jgi:hypothetical protein
MASVKPTGRRRGFARSIESALVDACSRSVQDVEAVIASASRKMPKSALSASLRAACAAGNTTIVDRLIAGGAKDWNGGLTAACAAGRLETAGRMITKGATSIRTNFEVVCIRGDLPLIGLLLTAGADQERGLNTACLYGQLAAVKLFISKGASAGGWSIESACVGGHLPVVDELISTVLSNQPNTAALYSACKHGQLRIVDYLISKGCRDWNDGLLGACQFNQIAAAEAMIANGADNLDAAVRSIFWHDSYRPHTNAESQLLAVLINAGANNAVLDAARDRSLLLLMLETTVVRRSALASVPKIKELVFDVADRTVDAARAGLNNVGWPRVLQTIVLEYLMQL